jgi:hypothetical protein
MANLKYDKILGITVGDEKIKYGILYGNEKIIFIKAGGQEILMKRKKRTRHT